MLSDHNYVKAFHQRQSKDLKRFGQGISPAVRRNHFHERQETLKHGCEDGDNHSSVSTGILGSEPWRDLDGDTLDDFGVDENAEIWEGEEVTLSSLLKDERM